MLALWAPPAVGVSPTWQAVGKPVAKGSTVLLAAFYTYSTGLLPSVIIMNERVGFFLLLKKYRRMDHCLR